MARLMDTLLIALSSLATACSLFPTRQTACSQDRPCPSGQSCRPDTATCEASPAVEDMAMSADLDTSPDMGTPAGMILVPGGQFTMGDNASTEADEKPAHPQIVDPFFMDITKVTASAFLSCFDSGKCTTQPDGATTGCTYKQSGKENHPVNCLTFAQANEFCSAYGKRLPTEIEFEYISRGPSGATYPWGNDPPLNQLCWMQAQTCPVMSFPATLFGSQNSAGLYDLGGNLTEWMGNPICGYPLTSSGGENCMIAGPDAPTRGSQYSASAMNEVKGISRSSATKNGMHGIVGFRCAKSIQ